MDKEIMGFINKEEKMALKEAIARQNENSRTNIINTNDIYQYVGVNLLARDYYESTLEEQSVMVEEELKRYIAHKLAYCNYFISDKKAMQTELSELLTTLYELNGKNLNIVNKITEFVLKLFTEIQHDKVNLVIEKDETYISNPVLEEKEGIFTALIYHKNTDPITVFNLVFEYYLTKCNQRELKREMKKEELPKNGE